MSNTSIDYHQLNADAHRKSVIRISPPALICQLGFWMPDSFLIVNRNSWKHNIDQIIIKTIQVMKRDFERHDAIYTNCRINNRLFLFNSAYDYNSIVGKDLGFAETVDRSALTSRELDILDNDQRVIILKARYVELSLTIKFELHTEFFTVMCVLQKARASDAESKLKSPVSAIRDAWEYIGNVRAALEAGFQDINELPMDFWTELFSRFIFTDNFNYALTGSVFADFRGLMISDETVLLNNCVFSRVTNNIICHSEVEKIRRIVATDQIKSGSDSNVVRRYEFTASTMLGRQILYITNLGPQFPERPDDQRIPVLYVIYVHKTSKDAPNRWQLGRLLDRLNLLGALRLAALKDLKQLRLSGRKLAMLDHIQKEIERDSRLAILKRIEDPTHLKNLAMAFQLELSRLPEINGGLSYRIERSRFYVSTFRSGIRSLRIGRVEGYLPYNHFVERRLGAIFDYIDRLGKRYERTLNNLFLKQSNYMTARLIEVNDELKKVSSEIRKIQKYGEFVLLSVLVPYYVSSLAEHAKIFRRNNAFGSRLIWSIFIGYSLFGIAKDRSNDLKTKFTPPFSRDFGIILFICVPFYSGGSRPYNLFCNI